MSPYQGWTQRQKKLQRNLQKKKTAAINKAWLRPVLFGAMIIGMLGLSVGYVIVVNASSTRGIHIAQLRVQAERMRSEQRELQIQVARLQSLQELEGKVAGNQLVVIDQVEYIKGNGGIVAQR
jgi:hypothetical protein